MDSRLRGNDKRFMKTLRSLHRFSEGHPHDRVAKIAVSFLIVTSLAVTSFSADTIFRLRKYARFMSASANQVLVTPR